MAKTNNQIALRLAAGALVMGTLGFILNTSQISKDKISGDLEQTVAQEQVSSRPNLTNPEKYLFDGYIGDTLVKFAKIASDKYVLLTCEPGQEEPTAFTCNENLKINEVGVVSRTPEGSLTTNTCYSFNNSCYSNQMGMEIKSVVQAKLNKYLSGIKEAKIEAEQARVN